MTCCTRTSDWTPNSFCDLNTEVHVSVRSACPLVKLSPCLCLPLGPDWSHWKSGSSSRPVSFFFFLFFPQIDIPCRPCQGRQGVGSQPLTDTVIIDLDSLLRIKENLLCCLHVTRTYSSVVLKSVSDENQAFNLADMSIR